MPESPADDPLKRTGARERLMRSVARGEVWCVAIPTARGVRWFPAGPQLAVTADIWLSTEAVRELWTSKRMILDAVIGRPYPMKLTDKGAHWLNADGSTENLGSSTDRRAS